MHPEDTDSTVRQTRYREVEFQDKHGAPLITFSMPVPEGQDTPDDRETRIAAQALLAAIDSIGPEDVAWWRNILDHSGFFRLFTRALRRGVLKSLTVTTDTPDELPPPEARAAVLKLVTRAVTHTLLGDGWQERIAQNVATQIVAWTALSVHADLIAEGAWVDDRGLLLAEVPQDEVARRFKAKWQEDGYIANALVACFEHELHAVDRVPAEALDNLLSEAELQDSIHDVLAKVTARIRERPAGGAQDTPGVGTTSRQPRTPARLPARTPQQTAQEVKYATQAMTDGPRFTGWEPIEGGEPAFRHVAAPDAPLQVRVAGAPIAAWLGYPNTSEHLRAEIQASGVPAVLLYHVCIASLLHAPDMTSGTPEITVSVDELIRKIGWEPRSRAERDDYRRRVWRWLVLCENWQVIGTRRSRGIYRTRGSRQPIDLTTTDALLRITGRADRPGDQLSFDGSTPPEEVTYVAGPWLSRLRGDQRVLTQFGDVAQIAAIPSGKPSGAWAQSIGLALNQRWREQAAYAQPGRVGDGHTLTVRFHAFTRRILLTLFAPSPPAPAVDAVLNSKNPGRARAYWREAIALLKAHGLISYYRCLDGPDFDAPAYQPARRTGWADEWLDQPLDIRPDDKGKAAITEIARTARAYQTRNKQGQGTSRTRGAGTTDTAR